MTEEFKHKSVMLNECIDALDIKQNGIYIDGTLGGAGHASSVLEHLGPGGLLIGIDRDDNALEYADRRLSDVKSEGSYITVKSVFSNIDSVFSQVKTDKGIDSVRGADGILLDLGVSSYQLDTPERGFSYRYDSQLDMRMDQDSKKTAAYIVNNYSEEALKRIFYEYGEEKNSPRISREICKRRKLKSIDTTLELAEIIKSAVPGRYSKTEGHPAKRVFQAIRIEVNDELTELENVLSRAIDILSPGGRLCIITFHSLEDRMVKRCFKKAEDPCECPSTFPICVCGKKPLGHIVGKGPMTAGEEELRDNNRAHSAKLRVFEKGTAGNG